mmetsp:Transcript_111654/g.315319  ORF Transcript_111654/g.315319 Transcript_111654/m.315319 type:complete len:232 (+) Transcript_111654:209-904(+)
MLPWSLIFALAKTHCNSKSSFRNNSSVATAALRPRLDDMLASKLAAAPVLEDPMDLKARAKPVTTAMLKQPQAKAVANWVSLVAVATWWLSASSTAASASNLPVTGSGEAVASTISTIGNGVVVTSSCGGPRTRLRLRVLRPLTPHVAVHADQALQSDFLQACGLSTQAAWHFFTCFASPRQSLPSLNLSIATSRKRDCSPLIGSHTPHCCQSPHWQSLSGPTGHLLRWHM